MEDAITIMKRNKNFMKKETNILLAQLSVILIEYITEKVQNCFWIEVIQKYTFDGYTKM